MLIAALALLSVFTVPLAGGRLGHMADLRLRGIWVLIAALLVQVVIISVIPGGGPTFHKALHLSTYALGLGWLVANRAILWRWTILVGGLLNLAVISANSGVMPASAGALSAAGHGQSHQFANSAAVHGAHLAFLGDQFGIPPSIPLHNVFSVGDVLIVLGVFLALHRQCESFLAYVLARAGDRLMAMLGAVANVARGGRPRSGAPRSGVPHPAM